MTFERHQNPRHKVGADREMPHLSSANETPEGSVYTYEIPKRSSPPLLPVLETLWETMFPTLLVLFPEHLCSRREGLGEDLHPPDTHSDRMPRDGPTSSQGSQLSAVTCSVPSSALRTPDTLYHDCLKITRGSSGRLLYTLSLCLSGGHIQEWTLRIITSSKPGVHSFTTRQSKGTHSMDVEVYIQFPMRVIRITSCMSQSPALTIIWQGPTKDLFVRNFLLWRSDLR